MPRVKGIGTQRKRRGKPPKYKTKPVVTGMMEESPGEEVSHVLPNHATGQMFSIPPPIIYTYGRLGMGYSETQRMVESLTQVSRSQKNQELSPNDAEPIDLTKVEIKIERDDDIVNNVSVQSKNSTIEKSQPSPPPFKKFKTAVCTEISYQLENNGSEAETPQEKVEARKKANNQRERIRVRDLNDAFKELGHLVTMYCEVENNLTKLQILKKAIFLINLLVQQVQEYKAAKGSTQKKEMKDASCQTFPTVIDYSGRVNSHQLIQQQLNAAWNVNVASKEFSSPGFNSFVNELKHHGVQSNGLPVSFDPKHAVSHTNNEEELNESVQIATTSSSNISSNNYNVEGNTRGKSQIARDSPVQSDSVHQRTKSVLHNLLLNEIECVDNFDQKWYSKPKNISHIEDNSKSHVKCEKSISCLPQLASPIGKNTAFQSGSLDQLASPILKENSAFSKNSAYADDSFKEVVNPVPQKTSVIQDDNFYEAVNSPSHVPTLCDNFNQVVKSIHKKVSSFGKDTFTNCDNFDQVLKSSQTSMGKDSFSDCDTFDKGLNSSPQLPSPLENDSSCLPDIDNVNPLTNSFTKKVTPFGKDYDDGCFTQEANAIRPPREKAIQMVHQPSESNGKMMDIETKDHRKLKGLPKEIRSLEKLVQMNKATTTREIVDQEVNNEPEGISRLEPDTDTKSLEEREKIETAIKEEKSDPDLGEDFRAVQKKESVKEAFTREIVVKQEKTDTEELVGSILNAGMLGESVTVAVVVKQEQCDIESLEDYKT